MPDRRECTFHYVGQNVDMSEDEEAIRALIDRWMSATQSGDMGSRLVWGGRVIDAGIRAKGAGKPRRMRSKKWTALAALKMIQKQTLPSPENYR